jgi:RecA/RadA recombinase
MASRSLARLHLTDSLVSSLHMAYGVTTAAELLSCSTLEVMNAGDLSHSQALEVLDSVASQIAPRSQTALTLLKKKQCEHGMQTTGIDELDSALRGGLLLGTISDVCGSPGAGKTQFCMGVTLQVVLEENSVIYIDAENKLDISRLASMARERCPDRFDLTVNRDAEHHLDTLLALISVSSFT